MRRRARAALVVAEVALAVAITTGSVLLLRSFVSVTNVNPGFETSQLLTWQMNLPQHLTNNTDRLAFYRNFFERMEALPGVVSVGRHHARAAGQHVGDHHGADRRPAGAGRGAARSAVPARDAQLLRDHGHPDPQGPQLQPGRQRHGAAGGGDQRDHGPPAVPKPGSARQARAHGPEPDGTVDDDRRRDWRHPPRRARGSAAAGAVHHLPAGTAGRSVHRPADDRRSGAADRDGARRGAAHRQEPADL